MYTFWNLTCLDLNIATETTLPSTLFIDESMGFHDTLYRIFGKLLNGSEWFGETYIFTWALHSQEAVHLPFDWSFSNVIKLLSWRQDRGRQTPMHLWHCFRPVGQKKVHSNGLLYERVLWAWWPEKGALGRTTVRATLCSVSFWNMPMFPFWGIEFLWCLRPLPIQI